MMTSSTSQKQGKNMSNKTETDVPLDFSFLSITEMAGNVLIKFMMLWKSCAFLFVNLGMCAVESNY